jgi:acetyl-CoA carboxylase carboxyl transferase subunit beta
MSWLQKRSSAHQGHARVRKAMPRDYGSIAGVRNRISHRPGRTSACHPRPAYAALRTRRIDQLLDPEGRYEIGSEVLPIDSLKFRDTRKYPERLSAALEGRRDGCACRDAGIRGAAGRRG